MSNWWIERIALGTKSHADHRITTSVRPCKKRCWRRKSRTLWLGSPPGRKCSCWPNASANWPDETIFAHRTLTLAPSPASCFQEASYYLLHKVQVLQNPQSEICSLVLLTDGEWIWPNDLRYYVRVYHCQIPEEFVLHMLSHNWFVPHSDELDWD